MTWYNYRNGIFFPTAEPTALKARGFPINRAISEYVAVVPFSTKAMLSKRSTGNQSPTNEAYIPLYQRGCQNGFQINQRMGNAFFKFFGTFFFIGKKNQQSKHLYHSLQQAFHRIHNKTDNNTISNYYIQKVSFLAH